MPNKMRIVIDLIASQDPSTQHSGKALYSESLITALAASHALDVVLLLDGRFPDSVVRLRERFGALLEQSSIQVFWSLDGADEWTLACNAQLYRAAVQRLKPDLVLHTDVEARLWALTQELSTESSQSWHDVILLDQQGWTAAQAAGSPEWLAPWQGRREQLTLVVTSLVDGQDQLIDGTSRDDYLVLGGAVRESLLTAPGAAVEDERAPFILTLATAGAEPELQQLYQAFFTLDASLRKSSQIRIVGELADGDRQALVQSALRQGLDERQIQFEGFVDDIQLARLYRTCQAFVCTGRRLGLAALEASTLGAPVFAPAGTPPAALTGLGIRTFHEAAELSAHLDAALRQKRATVAPDTVGSTTWPMLAQRLVDELQSRLARPLSATSTQRRLAFFSPLPPERTGVAGYSADLIPALARYYRIDAIVADDFDLLSDSSLSTHCTLRTVNWFLANADRYDRILYNLGNSRFHSYMLPALLRHPGVVVLHDFFIGDLVWKNYRYTHPEKWVALHYEAHGYLAARDCLTSNNDAAVTQRYPCNLSLLEGSHGVIVHSEYSKTLADSWLPREVARTFDRIPLLRGEARPVTRQASRERLGLPENAFIACSFGYMGPTKANLDIIQAWLSSQAGADSQSILIFVGANDQDDYGIQVQQAIDDAADAHRIQITGWVSDEDYLAYLGAADIAIQLRTTSRGESSAAVLDCMNYGLATIVNANGSMAELPADSVVLLDDEVDAKNLRNALDDLWRYPERREAISEAGRRTLRTQHTPDHCALEFSEKIEAFYQRPTVNFESCLPALQELPATQSQSDAQLSRLANALVRTLPIAKSARQILIDVSAICRTDLKTGIQRVVRSLLLELLESPPAGYRIEPVYFSDATGEWSLRYAREYVSGLIGVYGSWLQDELVECQPGDIFLGLDFTSAIIIENQRCQQFRSMHCDGVKSQFVVYDILPLLKPNAFPQGASEVHKAWVMAIAGLGEKLICISHAVASELKTWIAEQRIAPPKVIDAFHLGADVSSSAPTLGMPADAGQVLGELRKRVTFLMVGTIEPRKGVSQALAAFELLWAKGYEVNLALVGKPGWQVEALIKKLKKHPQLDQKLFWLKGISDEYLESIYATASCLLAASEAEGFGLPLIEAAQKGLPIIARDIPVFREVVGTHAYFFAGDDRESLATSLEDWLVLFEKGSHPQSSDMPWLTWKQSAEQLKALIT